MANNTTQPEQEFLNAENNADKEAQIFEANNTVTQPERKPKPKGACEHIRPAPYTNGWYCNLLIGGTPICDRCSRNVGA